MERKWKESLQRIELQLVSLHDAHKEAVRTAKHLAHVRDLARVSALRELTLERDKLGEELRNAK